MKKKVTYTKDAFLHIRVDSADKKRWALHAKLCGVNLTSLIVSVLNEYIGGRAK